MTDTKKPNHYVNNAEFTGIIQEWRDSCQQALENGLGRPAIPEAAGKIIMMICDRYSMKHNFRGYPFREDLVSTAIEACIKAFPNFDPAKSTNPLSYFTQCAHYAFIGVISKEKRQLYTRIKMIQEGAVEYFDVIENDNTIESSQKAYLLNFLDKNEQEIEFGFLEKKKEPVEEKEKPRVVSPLDEFIEGEE